jgi:hypothetical protein
VGRLFPVGQELLDQVVPDGVSRRLVAVIPGQQRPGFPLDQGGRHVQPFDIEVQIALGGGRRVCQKAGDDRRHGDLLDGHVLPAHLVEQQV